MNLGRARPEAHVILKTLEAHVDLLEDQLAFSKVQMDLRYFVLFVVLNGLLKFAYGLLETTGLGEDHSDKVEDQRGWLYAFIQAFIEVIEGAIKIAESVVQQSSNHEERAIVLYCLHLLYGPHRALEILLLLILQLFGQDFSREVDQSDCFVEGRLNPVGKGF